MMMALAGDARFAVRAGAGRRDAAAGGGRGRGADSDRSARGLRMGRSRWRRRRSWDAAPARRRAAGASFWGRRRRRRWWARRLGMSLAHSALAPSGHPIWLDMARRSARAVMSDGGARPVTMQDVLTDASRAQCDGDACGVRRLDESDFAFAGDRACGGAAAADGGRLDAHQSDGAAAGGCAAEWAAASSDGAGVSGGRRAGGDAASAAGGAAGDEGADGERRNAGRDAGLVGAIGDGARSCGRF